MVPVTQRPVLRVSPAVVGTFFPGVGGNVGGSRDQPLTRTLLNLEAPVKALVERGEELLFGGLSELVCGVFADLFPQMAS